MENQENNTKTTPDQQEDAPCILNEDTSFENSDIDPGFSPEGDDKEIIKEHPDRKEKIETSNEKEVNEKHGLDELDGTNPGSNAHPMDV